MPECDTPLSPLPETTSAAHILDLNASLVESLLTIAEEVVQTTGQTLQPCWIVEDLRTIAAYLRQFPEIDSKIGGLWALDFETLERRNTNP